MELTDAEIIELWNRVAQENSYLAPKLIWLVRECIRRAKLKA